MGARKWKHIRTKAGARLLLCSLKWLCACVCVYVNIVVVGEGICVFGCRFNMMSGSECSIFGWQCVCLLGRGHYAKRCIMWGKGGISLSKKLGLRWKTLYVCVAMCVCWTRHNTSSEYEAGEKKREGKSKRMMRRGGNVCLDKMSEILCPLIVLT